MKFVYYLEKVSGVDIMALISLGVFFLFFVAMIIWVYKTKKENYEEISKIPLGK